MSLLASLVRAYDRMPDKAPFGYAEQAVQFVLEIDEAGKPVGGLSAFGYEKKRLVDRVAVVPYFGGRSGSNAPPYFLWDNSAYVLGVTAKEGFDAAKRLEAFRELHLDALAQSTDTALVAVRRFLEAWTPGMFEALGFPEDAKDRNIVFRYSGQFQFVHECDEAVRIWKSIYKPDVIGDGICLVTGKLAPIARLHPPLKTFDNPARIVSFDKDNDAFSSYGHVQAENAPTGIEAAFQYSAVLNRFLQRDSGHRLQIGDASTVFWADASEAEAAQAEGFFAAFFDAAATEKIETLNIGAQLARIRAGERLANVTPQLASGVRFCVLGLAPNAARLSVRFWWEDDFGTLTAHYQRYLDDMRLDPPPRDDWPPLWKYLSELAPQGKRENVPPLIAGEWMRAILTGAPYPLTLLSTVLMRIRADGEINALRAGMLKSVLIRNFAKEVPVALDPGNTNKGYILGRLFAVYEEVQRSALGGNVNATIKDKFYGAASASPQKVFRTLDAGAQNHFAKLRKLSPGRAVNLEKLLSAITDLMEPGNDPIPASLASAEQALFGIGYYHQRADFFRKHDDTPTTEADE